MHEIACAPSVVPMLGHRTLDWKVLEKFLDTGFYPNAYQGTYTHDDYLGLIDTTFATIQVIVHQRNLIHEVKTGLGTSRLLDVLARFRFLNASYPQDKIYGLIGLATDAIDITVDYTSRSQTSTWSSSKRTSTRPGIWTYCAKAFGVLLPREGLRSENQASIYLHGVQTSPAHTLRRRFCSPSVRYSMLVVTNAVLRSGCPTIRDSAYKLLIWVK